MPYLTTILITLLLAVPALSVELFRYRSAAKAAGRWNTSLMLMNRILPMLSPKKKRLRSPPIS
jgi:hypothetical protein